MAVVILVISAIVVVVSEVLRGVTDRGLEAGTARTTRRRWRWRHERDRGRRSAAGRPQEFGDVHAVDDVSLEVAEGEFITLLGPSGCGKTTTMRMIAGFEEPDAGGILLRGTTSSACRRTSAR